MASSTVTGNACASCVFFDDHLGNTADVSGDAGLCRYNPPVSQPEPNSRGLWPVVTSNDWCGHFTAPRGHAAQIAAE